MVFQFQGMKPIGAQRPPSVASQVQAQTGVPSFAQPKAPPTASEVAARSGYKPIAGGNYRKVQASRSLVRPAIVDTKPEDAFLRGGQQQDPLEQASLYDAQQQQNAANEQWARNNQAIGQIGSFVGGLKGRIVDPGVRDANQLRTIGDRTLGEGEDLADPYHQMSEDLMREGEGDRREAYRLGDQAVRDMQGAEQGFADQSAMDMSATAAGIRQNAAAAKQQLMGPTPDGRMRTEAEVQQGQAQIRQQVESQVQQAITPIMSQYNATRATLRQAIGQMRMNNAQLRLQGSGQMAQTAQAASGIRATGDSMAMENTKLATNLYTVASQLEQGAQLAAAQLEAQGYTQMAQLIQQNPRSLVSWFSTLLAMEGVEAARGSATAGAQPQSPGQTQSQGTSRKGRGRTGFGDTHSKGGDLAANKERRAKGEAAKTAKGQATVNNEVSTKGIKARDAGGKWGLPQSGQPTSPAGTPGGVPRAETFGEVARRTGALTLGQASDWAGGLGIDYSDMDEMEMR